jgi:hypothetical protein
MFESMKLVGNQTRVKTLKTETGVKDAFLEHFLGGMASSHSGLKASKKQAVLNQHILTLDGNVYSPVWRICGLDPHSDTPVKILHDLLLGCIKYFWCDVIQNHLKKDNNKRKTLIACLSLADVSGLGISALSGETLVNFSGSLTGGDFHAIVQIALFVLYGLVSAPCYKTWVALSNLIPLVWQPTISDINSHLVRFTYPLVLKFYACSLIKY